MATNNEQTIWNYLYGKIGNAYGVAGLMGNLYAESALLPNNLQNTYEKSLGMTDDQYTTAVDNGTYTNFVKDSAGYGLAQWTYYSRKQGLLDLATSKKVSIADLDMQLEYLMQELTKDFSAVLSSLKSATTVLEASNIVLTKFEAPADQSSSVQTQRANYGITYYNKYATSATASSSTSGGTTVSNLTIVQNSGFKTHNTSARSGSISYLVIHYVGALGSAQANINYYNQSSATGASADFFVDHDGSLYQYNPDPSKRYCWAVGGGSSGTYFGKCTNANSIHIEMCVKSKTGKAPANPNDSNWYFTDETIAGTVELAKYLMSKYSIKAANVIRHYDVNTKLCPGVVGWNPASGSESAWTSFKAKIGDGSASTVTESTSSSTSSSGTVMYYVRKTWGDTKTQKGAFSVLQNAKNCADSNSGYYVFDASGNSIYPTVTTNTTESGNTMYRVRKTWDDAKTQKGAFSSLANAKACCDKNSGYYVFDAAGNIVYPEGSTSSSSSSSSSFSVKVSIPDLRIRKGAGTNYDTNGKYTGVGTFTIVKTKSGTGSTAGWGLLKAYEKNEDGWISLDYCTVV